MVVRCSCVSAGVFIAGARGWTASLAETHEAYQTPLLETEQTEQNLTDRAELFPP